MIRTRSTGISSSSRRFPQLAARTRSAGALLGVFACFGLVAVSAAPAAEAGTMYRWETENGTLAYADDVRRIPDRYRAKAEAIVSENLDGYSRFTPTDAGAQQVHADRLADRLDGLRALTADEASEVGILGDVANPGGKHPVDGIALQSVREGVGRRLVNTSDGPKWKRTTRLQTVDAPVPVLGVSADPESDEPVVVERMRARSRGSLVTRQVTVVRQGDRVLSVIKPRSRHSSSDWPIEEDLEASR